MECSAICVCMCLSNYSFKDMGEIGQKVDISSYKIHKLWGYNMQHKENGNTVITLGTDVLNLLR